MRTTVDLPPSTHRRASEIARQRGTSLSTTVADLTARGLAALGDDVELGVSPVSGLPTLSIGRPTTLAEVREALDDE